MLLAGSAFLTPWGIADSLAEGGGGALSLPSDEISPADRARINAAIDISVKTMMRTGRFAPPPAGAHVTFQWPLQLVPGHPELVARTVTNFVDHNLAYPNQVQDYMCNARTYDQSNGYNHQGTDITSWPFAQRKQNNDEAIVVAAAAGVIVFKEDGMPDHSCSLSSQQWNAVYLRHSDGSVTWYGHLKANSLTTKQIGDAVAAGEFLGVMGSSGDSTGPHVHFEVHDSAGNVIDPFAGPCNNSNADSWWTQQRPYYESALDLVMTGSAPVQFNACPAPDTESHSAYFHPGQTVYVTAFLTDQLQANPTVFTLYMPNGAQFSTASMTSDATFYAASYWWWGFPLPSNAMSGTWRADVAFNGQTKSIEFDVGTTGEPPRTNIVEYHNAALNDYFVTSYPAEIAMLDAGTVVPGWTRTGTTFPAYSAPDPDLDTVCRFYGAPGTGISTHFYTAFAPECAGLMQNPAWKFEGYAFYIDTPDGVQCPAATRPVFRLYNNSMDGVPRHRYATSWPVVNSMQSQGWLLEGVAMCTPL